MDRERKEQKGETTSIVPDECFVELQITVTVLLYVLAILISRLIESKFFTTQNPFAFRCSRFKVSSDYRVKRR